MHYNKEGKAQTFPLTQNLTVQLFTNAMSYWLLINKSYLILSNKYASQ
jgi:hypothetical protein